MPDPIYILCPPEALEGVDLAKPCGHWQTPSLTTEGFIHASPAHQLNRVANTYFADQQELVLLTIEPEALTAPLRWEISTGGEAYPHLYGPLNLNALSRSDRFYRNSAGRFEISI